MGSAMDTSSPARYPTLLCDGDSDHKRQKEAIHKKDGFRPSFSANIMFIQEFPTSG